MDHSELEWTTRSDDNEGVLRFTEISSITGASVLGCLESYQDTLWNSLTPLQRCSRCILWHQLTGPDVQSFYWSVLVGRPTLACPRERVYMRTSLISSFLLLQQCPMCLVGLIWIVLKIRGKWPYIGCFVRCCFKDLFNIARFISLAFRKGMTAKWN